MDTVLIMCAGSGKRWVKQGYKQLVPVPPDGGPLLLRTINQCHKHGVRPHVIARTRELHLPGSYLYEIGQSPLKTECQSTDILATQELWVGRVAILLGDVFFTDACMARIAGGEGLKVYGRIGDSNITGGGAEVFAMVWDAKNSGPMIDALKGAAMHTQQAEEDGRVRYGAHRPGTLWQPYRLLDGLDIEDHAVGNRGVWVEHDDATDDFDTPERYAEWNFMYSMRGKTDEE